jgi:hypothetical protein
MEHFELISEQDHCLMKLLTSKNKYGIIQPTRICLLNLGDIKSTTADLFKNNNKCFYL